VRSRAASASDLGGSPQFAAYGEKPGLFGIPERLKLSCRAVQLDLLSIGGAHQVDWYEMACALVMLGFNNKVGERDRDRVDDDAFTRASTPCR
jgi:hypothetical protein